MTTTTMVLIASALTLLLGSLFLFAPKKMLSDWGLKDTDEAKVMSRRLGTVYLGLSQLLYWVTTIMPSDSKALAIGGATFTGVLVIQGLVELVRGNVSKGFLVSTVVDTILTIAFLSTLM
jgi:hypothetical protein